MDERIGRDGKKCLRLIEDYKKTKEGLRELVRSEKTKEYLTYYIIQKTIYATKAL